MKEILMNSIVWVICVCIIIVGLFLILYGSFVIFKFIESGELSFFNYSYFKITVKLAVFVGIISSIISTIITTKKD